MQTVIFTPQILMLIQSWLGDSFWYNTECTVLKFHKEEEHFLWKFNALRSPPRTYFPSDMNHALKKSQCCYNDDRQCLVSCASESFLWNSLTLRERESESPRLGWDSLIDREWEMRKSETEQKQDLSVVQWLRLHGPNARDQAWSLVRELDLACCN